jgi:glycosyltransferase involved in cell wall biosynthesis
MPAPKVSIGLPVYKGEKYLRCALDSILQQDHTGFELIISDNAANDATRQICCEYSARDPRSRYYRNETNTRASSTFNRVFESARLNNAFANPIKALWRDWRRMWKD